MPSPTETAILAFVAALETVAVADSAAFPKPLRNEDLVTRLVNIGDSSELQGFVNVLDGRRSDSDEFLGADIFATDSYDIEHDVEVEFAAVGGESAAREAAFDAMRTAIWDAVKPVVVGGNPQYLGGAVNGIKLKEMLDQQNTNLDGVPNVKAALFVFALSFTSKNPF